MITFGLLYWAIIDHKMFDNAYDWLNYFMSGPGHLWFLAVLFVCFVVMVLSLNLYNWANKSLHSKLIVICLLLFLYVGSLFAPTDFRIAQFCQYFIYFVLGYWTFAYRQVLKSAPWSKVILLGITTVFLIMIKLLFIQCKPDHFFLINHVNNLFIGLAGSYSFLLLCMKCPEGTYLSVIGTWNGFFGVYIYHQFILRILYYHSDLLVGVNKYLVGIVAMILTLLLSCILAEIFLKSKFKKLI